MPARSRWKSIFFLLTGLALMVGSNPRMFAHAQGSSSAPAPPAKPAASPSQTPGPVFRFQYGGNVAQIPFDFNGNMMFVPVRIAGGQPCLFLVDSGVAESAIDRQKLADLGLSAAVPAAGGAPRAPNNGTNNNKVNQKTAPYVGMPSLRVVSFADLSKNLGRAVEGVIGTDVLSRFVIEIDYDRLSLRLFDPASYQYSGKTPPLPLDASSDLLTVPVRTEVPGRKNSTAQFAIDTGFPDAIEFQGAAAELHKHFFTHERTRLALIPTEMTGPPPVEGRIKEVQLGKFTFTEPAADFSRAPVTPPPAGSAHSPIAGVIGNEILRRFKVIIDPVKHQAILEPGHHYNEPFEIDMSGMVLQAEGPSLKTIRVADVLEHSPAHSAGIQKGDIIAGIQSEPAVELHLADLRDLFTQPEKEVKMTLDRNGKTVDVKLKLPKENTPGGSGPAGPSLGTIR
jgi:hypothetical protein